jgi:FkbM family methyltransferase
VPRLRLGRRGVDWCLCPTGLGPDSIVYSFGIGEDVSFELALMDRFNLRIQAFDPTPRSLAWLRGQALPPGFILHEFGLAAWDGFASFTAPADPAHVSYSMIPDVARPAVSAPVHRLATIASQLGHSRVNLVKMDIEGGEYTVLPECLSSGPPIDQLLVEFHHRWPSVGVAATRHVIGLLRDAGYRIAHVSPSGFEYTFLHAAGATGCP